MPNYCITNMHMIMKGFELWDYSLKNGYTNGFFFMRLIFFTVFEKGGNPVITVFQKGSWFDERQTASKLSDSLKR